MNSEEKALLAQFTAGALAGIVAAQGLSNSPQDRAINASRALMQGQSMLEEWKGNPATRQTAPKSRRQK